MHPYTISPTSGNSSIASDPQLQRPSIPEPILSQLVPSAREIWRRTHRAPSTCNAIASAWAFGSMVEG
jgi:hypothetical protein